MPLINPTVRKRMHQKEDPKNPNSLKKEEWAPSRNLADANIKQLRSVAEAKFLYDLANVPKLTKLKLLGLGFSAQDIKTLLSKGHLVEDKDKTTGVCYYKVVLPKME